MSKQKEIRIGIILENDKYMGFRHVDLEYSSMDIEQMKQFLQYNDFQISHYRNFSIQQYDNIIKDILNKKPKIYSEEQQIQKWVTCEGKFINQYQFLDQIIKQENTLTVMFSDTLLLNQEKYNDKQYIQHLKLHKGTFFCIEANLQKERIIEYTSATQKFLKFLLRKQVLEFKYLVQDFINNSINNNVQQGQIQARLNCKYGTKSQESFKLKSKSQIQIEENIKNNEIKLQQKLSEFINDEDKFDNNIIYQQTEQFEQILYVKQLIQITTLYDPQNKNVVQDEDSNNDNYQVLDDCDIDEYNYVYIKPHQMISKLDFSRVHQMLGIAYIIGKIVVDIQKGQQILLYYIEQSKNIPKEDCNVGLAYYGLGYQYKYAIGQQQDYKESASYFLKSIEYNDRRALYELGDQYYWGKGLNEHEGECHYYCQLSAQSGYLMAQYWFARNQIEGECGIKQNEKEGLQTLYELIEEKQFQIAIKYMESNKQIKKQIMDIKQSQQNSDNNTNTNN